MHCQAAIQAYDNGGKSSRAFLRVFRALPRLGLTALILKNCQRPRRQRRRHGIAAVLHARARPGDKVTLFRAVRSVRGRGRETASFLSRIGGLIPLAAERQVVWRQRCRPVLRETFYIEGPVFTPRAERPSSRNYLINQGLC